MDCGAHSQGRYLFSHLPSYGETFGQVVETAANKDAAQGQFRLFRVWGDGQQATALSMAAKPDAVRRYRLFSLTGQLLYEGSAYPTLLLQPGEVYIIVELTDRGVQTRRVMITSQ